MVLYLIGFFILGTIMGSFYNVLGTRIPRNESIIKPSSHCEKCGHKLKWYELIPIFSFIFLKGRCHNCKEKLSIMYPVTELFSGILFAISYYSYGFTLELIIALTLSSLLIMVISSDITYMIIPDRFTIISAVIIIIVKCFDIGLKGTLTAVLYGIISFSVMFAIMKLGSAFFHKECLGGGDVKLMFVVGLVLDPLLSLLVIVIASMIALPASVWIYYKNREHAIPFGPFLIIGLLIIYFTKINFTDILNWL